MTRKPHRALTWAALLFVGAAAFGCGNKAGGSGSANGAGSSAEGAGGAGSVTIDILSGSTYGGAMSYSPDPASVKVGQSVQWVNRDSVDHTASQMPSGFDTGVLAPGETSDPITMTAPGTFTYTCVVSGHRMSGTLSVVP